MESLDILGKPDFDLVCSAANKECAKPFTRIDLYKARVEQLYGAAIHVNEGFELLFGNAQGCLEAASFVKKRVDKFADLLNENTSGLPKKTLENLEEAEMLARASIDYMEKSAKATQALLEKVQATQKD